MLIADYIAIGALIACMLVLCAGARTERTRNARRWRQCDGRELDRKGLVFQRRPGCFGSGNPNCIRPGSAIPARDDREVWLD
jgi:hypothetical protein